MVSKFIVLAGCLSATLPVAALEGVAEFRPDLVILDYSMPGMNGGEGLLALRERPDTAHIPIVFMTPRA